MKLISWPHCLGVSLARAFAALASSRRKRVAAEYDRGEIACRFHSVSSRCQASRVKAGAWASSWTSSAISLRMSVGEVGKAPLMSSASHCLITAVSRMNISGERQFRRFSGRADFSIQVLNSSCELTSSQLLPSAAIAACRAQAIWSSA
jgi:hypothetical protein